MTSKPNTYTVQEIVQWCDSILDTHSFKDYSPNGLQVDADTKVSKIITGVTACEALIDEAIKQKAHAILVHHGYFWKGEPEPLVGMKGRRIRKLLQHGISLIAYHLPLDAHPEIGNNAQLIQQLGFTVTEPLFPESVTQKHKVGDIAQLDEPISAHELIPVIQKVLNKTPLHIKAHDRQYKRIGVCTGGAQDFIKQASQMNCDAFISGEISERTTHEARELGIDYYACGHHATEMCGIQALGEALALKFQIEVEFIDIDNPA